MERVIRRRLALRPESADGLTLELSEVTCSVLCLMALSPDGSSEESRTVAFHNIGDVATLQIATLVSIEWVEAGYVPLLTWMTQSDKPSRFFTDAVSPSQTHRAGLTFRGGVLVTKNLESEIGHAVAISRVHTRGTHGNRVTIGDINHPRLAKDLRLFRNVPMTSLDRRDPPSNLFNEDCSPKGFAIYTAPMEPTQSLARRIGFREDEVRQEYEEDIALRDIWLSHLRDTGEL